MTGPLTPTEVANYRESCLDASQPNGRIIIRLCDTVDELWARIAALEAEDAKKAAQIAALEIFADVPRVNRALISQAARIAELEAAHANCPLPAFDGTALNELGTRIIAEQRAVTPIFCRNNPVK
jgi:hypothetical protein